MEFENCAQGFGLKYNRDLDAVEIVKEMGVTVTEFKM